MYRIHVTFRDQEKGKEKVLPFKAAYFIFLVYFSFTDLVGWLFNAFWYLQEYDYDSTDILCMSKP